MSKKKQIIFSSLLGIVLLVVIFMPKKETTEPLDEIEVTDSLEVKEITYKYGIPIDDYDVDYGIVKRNQSLSTILQKHGLSVGEVHRLVEKSKDVFDVRKIRSDQAYAVFTTRDSIPETCYFVYEIDPKSYVVFDLRGDYRVTMGENPVEWRRNELHGVVESSLWLAMSKYNADPQLAVVLSNIFGWTIDFFGLQKQDEFRVIYEQEYVDGKSLLNFNVLGAAFRQYFIDETAIYVKGKVGPKWGKEGNELTFTIQKVGLLEALTENAIRSITLQVDIEKLTLETVTEIHELFTTDVNSESYKEAQQKAAEQRTQKNSDPENFEEPVTAQNDIPLNFMLFDRQGNSVKMFSRTCKIRRSRELYEYFENNDSIKMKIN